MSRHRPGTARGRSLPVVLSLAYVAALALLVLIFAWGGDRRWWATLAFFAPRWIWGVPLVPLVALVLSAPRGRGSNLSLCALALGAGLLVGPILGFIATPASLFRGAGIPARTIRVMTANVEREAADGVRLTHAIAAADVDIVALQEWDDRIEVTWPPGWRAIRPGPELLIASRLPFNETAVAAWPDPPGEPVNMALAVIDTDFGPLHLMSLHLTSPRPGLGEMVSRRTLLNLAKIPALESAIAARLEESRTAAAWGRAMAPAPLLVVGDFNMPDDSRIFRESWGGFTDAFRAAGFGFGATTRASFGPIPVPSRIDHQLAGPGWRCRAARIGPDTGADHRPLIAEWEWTGRVPAPAPTPPAPIPSRRPPFVREEFDETPAGTLPPGFELWRNGRLARGGVIAGEPGRGGVLSLDTDDSGADVRVWTSGAPTTVQELQLDLRLDTLNPIRILVGGSDFATRVPTARGLELIRGMEARLLAVEPDGARELARVRSREWQETDWVRVTLRMNRGELDARIVRVADGAWLTFEGTWAPPPVGWTLTAIRLREISGSQVGIWRLAGYTGPILTDRWRLYGPNAEAGPDSLKP